MSCRRVLYLSLLLALSGCSTLSLGPSSSSRETTAPNTQATATGTTADEENVEAIDSTRRGVRGFAVWLGETVNSWFGDKPYTDGGKVSHGQLAVRLRWDENDGVDTSVRFRARFDLPNLRNKAYVFFGQENERELISDRPETFSREQQLLPESRKTDQTGFVGVGVKLREYLDFRVGFRGGLNPYAQTRFRRDWMLSTRNRVEFQETVFWRRHDGLGSTTALNLEHIYTPSLSLKWQNAATVTEETDGFAWSSSLGMFKTFGDNKQLSVEALITGETEADPDPGEYGVRMKWLQPVYREWLLGEFILGHFWPRKDDNPDNERSWAVGAGLIMHF